MRGHDPDPLQHLAHDHLDVLVVDVHTLAPVHLLHLIDQVLLSGSHTPDLEDLFGVEGTLGERGSRARRCRRRRPADGHDGVIGYS